MKYIIIFLMILLFIAPTVEENKSISTVLKDGVYNYITCLDTSASYLVDNVAIIEKLTQIPYSKSYDKIMKNRVLKKHFVVSGETLDDIIKNYNNNIGDLKTFRKVIYMENKDVITRSYEIKSNEYILVPSDKLISKKD